MSGTRQEQTADYVLGLMEAGEASSFERDLARDPALAREVSAGLEALHPLDGTATPIAPGGELWQAIAQRISQAAHALPARRPASALWHSLRFWRWTGMGGLAAAAGLAAVAVPLALKPAPAPQFIAILDSPDGRVAGAVVEIDAAGVARLIPLEDVPVPQGRALQVWTLQDRQQGPVSVGLISAARRVRLDLGAVPRPTLPNQLFEITLEPQAGSATGRPTGPVLFKGRAARAL